MYNDKKCVGIVFDPSYVVHRIDIPMGWIYDIITKNKSGYIVYGGIDRLCSHVEEYAKVHKIPKERLIRLCIPFRCSREFVSMEVTSKWLVEMLSLNPDVIYVFRDNNVYGMTSALVRSCIDRNIKVIEYNNKGLNRTITSDTIEDVSRYYTTRPGEIYVPK